MIPINISKESVIKAIRQIDEDGIPSKRLSTKYYLVYSCGKHKLYPPKYVLSIANKIENGIELNPSEFSGGAETNTILNKLGFEIKQVSSVLYNSGDNVSPEENDAKLILNLATVVIHSPKRNPPPNECRTQLLEKIVLSCIDSNVILLPAGFYEYECVATKIQTKEVERIVSGVLAANNSSAVVCFGTDYDASADQLAYAATAEGLVAAGRKFYPTKSEKGYIRHASSCFDKELELERTFIVCGHSLYLAVCYDIYGIKHSNFKASNIDVVLNLIHSFYPNGPNSGDVQFVRKGFPGASKNWNCPVFGAVVFFEREIPTTWPSGAFWNGEEKDLNYVKYEDFTIPWDSKEKVESLKESAIIYKYSCNKHF